MSALGARLLQRSTKSSQPTEVGWRHCEILDATAALEVDVDRLVDKPAGLLLVAAPVDFSARMLTFDIDIGEVTESVAVRDNFAVKMSARSNSWFSRVEDYISDLDRPLRRDSMTDG